MNTNLVLAPKLVAGDLVRLVSPASYPDQSHVDDYIKTIESWGLRCDTGDHVLSKHGYMAGTDEQRLSDLNKAFGDTEVRAIITTRGGAGAYRIADDIDFSLVRADPKPIVGFSDITGVQLALLKNCGAGSIHGCLVGQTAMRTSKQLLMSTDAIELKSNPLAVTGAVQFEGSAKGPVIGGNLQGLATSVGVHLPSLEGAILFIEYHKAGLGTVDRYLTQLIRSGALDGVAGIALGSFERARGHVDRDWTMVDVLNDRLSALNVPVLGGLFAGHDLTDEKGDYDQSCLPLGSIATMDVSRGSLIVESIMR